MSKTTRTPPAVIMNRTRGSRPILVKTRRRSPTLGIHWKVIIPALPKRRSRTTSHRTPHTARSPTNLPLPLRRPSAVMDPMLHHRCLPRPMPWHQPKTCRRYLRFERSMNRATDHQATTLARTLRIRQTVPNHLADAEAVRARDKTQCLQKRNRIQSGEDADQNMSRLGQRARYISKRIVRQRASVETSNSNGRMD